MENRSMDTAEMNKEKLYFELGKAAKGTIEPRPEQMDRLDEVTECLANGEFHVDVLPGMTIPAVCVDGRWPSPLAPNAAGGTLTVFAGDDLTTKRLAAEDGTTAAGLKNTIEVLQGEGHEVGGHTDMHAVEHLATEPHSNACGCGACVKMDQIYQYISENGDFLYDTVKSLGAEPAGHETIVGAAGDRVQFSEGKELYDTVKNAAKPEFAPAVEGDHLEAVLVMNMQEGTTLDREALAARFPGIMAFNADVWSFKHAADATSLSEEESSQKQTGMAYFNIATACVLGGPKLRVVVLR